MWDTQLIGFFLWFPFWLLVISFLLLRKCSKSSVALQRRCHHNNARKLKGHHLKIGTGRKLKFCPIYVWLKINRIPYCDRTIILESLMAVQLGVKAPGTCATNVFVTSSPKIIRNQSCAYIDQYGIDRKYQKTCTNGRFGLSNWKCDTIRQTK